MSSDIEKKVREATNELQKDQFIQDLGQKAIVERSPIENDQYFDNLRAVLNDLGQDISTVGKAPKGMQYRGSLSVHVYSSTILNSAAFVTLNNLKTLDGAMADAALRELTGNVMQQFTGRRGQKLRSGF